MSMLVDTNFWIALSLDSHPGHGLAREWHWAAPLSSGCLWFCRHTEISFVRLISQTATMQAFGRKALSNTDAALFLTELQSNPAVTCEPEPAGTKELWLKLAASELPSPKVWMDAYLAAFAITNGAAMVTFDKGFRKFEKAGLSLRLLE